MAVSHNSFFSTFTLVNQNDIPMNDHNPNNMPPWARKIDDYGKRRWHKEKPYSSKRAEFIWNIIWNFVFLWVVNKIPDWDLDFIRNNYGAVLWILNVNIVVQIVGNFLLVMITLHSIRYLIRILVEASGLVTLLSLYYIYPFDFSHWHGWFWLDWFLPVAFIIGMVVAGFKILSNIWKLIFWR